MIQLVKARFTNFRLLRDVELSFARDVQSPVTVIRAENGTGKTTVLTALTWALFGDEGIPGRRSGFRLHPIDWDPARDGASCKITADVTFVTVDALALNSPVIVTTVASRPLAGSTRVTTGNVASTGVASSHSTSACRGHSTPPAYSVGCSVALSPH